MSEDVRAAAERLIEDAERHWRDYDREEQFAVDILTVAQVALEAADRQAALAAELGQVKEALLEFIHAYANTDRLDHDGTEVKLFTAWIRGCAALGIKAEGHAALDAATTVAPGAEDAGEGSDDDPSEKLP
jgi:hypothetical protein